MKWIRFNQQYPQRWARKSDTPNLGQYCRPVHVEFPFERAWIMRDHEGRVLMPGGGWAETFDFYLHTPGHVIGLADMATADGKTWSIEWRTAMADKRLAR